MIKILFPNYNTVFLFELQVENNELEFDHCLASFDMADKIKHLQKVLREKMPHTRRGKKFVIPIVQLQWF